MPRLSVEDASAAGAAMAYALSTLPLDAPQRPDWERTLRRLQQRLEVALSQHTQRQGRRLSIQAGRTHRSTATPCGQATGNPSRDDTEGAKAVPCTPVTRN
ncbi:hypothetical protein X880_3618 [Burkholderia pseudomallei MSHR4032]|nr:hypothetical protein BDL_4891 [Burkholderia pseudomallei MSHR305]AGZ30691.1 hypothetical protein BBK_4194 [Burkholderia pseudomallei NCTC 13179]AHK69057.1 hypothetical protein BBX_4053 [Burkholderia pseudomallei MSHR520]AIP83814.1 hypothetical protein JE55_6050 [Burkholderia pseudomallei]KGU91119.1 hypothetical protein X880_3618 [Burkholderia pseudomallei MSHR4032]KGV16991.1 hypothetical protein X895_3655 [Burkholderia pseudomallei MSHR4503]